MFKKIYIEITNICNLKCTFCPEINRKKQSMSIEDFEEIIRKIHKHTKLVCLHVKGEPLLHNKLEEILEILEKYDLKANITTNGTLIKDKLEIIKNSNLGIRTKRVWKGVGVGTTFIIAINLDDIAELPIDYEMIQILTEKEVGEER